MIVVQKVLYLPIDPLGEGGLISLFACVSSTDPTCMASSS